jgi:hypothetical protein
MGESPSFQLKRDWRWLILALLQATVTYVCMNLSAEYRLRHSVLCLWWDATLVKWPDCRVPLALDTSVILFGIIGPIVFMVVYLRRRRG